MRNPWPPRKSRDEPRLDEPLLEYSSSREERELRFTIPTQILEQIGGVELEEWQSALVESAVMGYLSARSARVLRVLHHQVHSGDYRYPLDEFVAKFLPGLG